MSEDTITVQDLHSDLKTVAAKWEMVGIHLGIPKDVLDGIKADVTNSSNSKAESCFHQVINAWLCGPKDKVTVPVLAEAVRLAGYGTLASSLLKEGPSLTLNMKTVSKRLKDCRAKYSSLGLHLGVSFSLIKEFETTRGDAALCLLHMLDYYLANGEPSVREMCEALETAERRDVSRSISEKYHGRSFRQE